jgi:hypothetical protein
MTHETMDEDLTSALIGLEPIQDDELPAPNSGAAPDTNGMQSPTLLALETSRRPKLKTVCETCQNSVWFTTPQEVKCYCRVMFLVTWSNKEPTQFTGCDGLYIEK